MKEIENMPPPAGVVRAKRAGLGRWSAGKGAAEAWRFATAPFHVPLFFPLRATVDQAPEQADSLHAAVQMDLSL
jgi:hypothetical protein